MRVRAQDADGDYMFGQGGANFLVNSPECVAQIVQTRLLLWTGEWFLDKTEGTPYLTQVLGTNTKGLYDQAIQQRVLGTQGVLGISAYSSELAGRGLSVSMTLDTIFGATTANSEL